MNWQLSQLKFALGLGGMMSFYGAVSLVIMLLPPDSFGGRRYQVATIILVLLTLPIALIIMFVSARRAKKKAKKEEEAAQQAADAATAAAAPQAPATPVGNYATLTSGTEEAVQFLKTSNLGSTGRDAIYSLPWYLVAGAPRAGKSSLVLSSNLNFQTLPSQRQSEQKFIRPTGSIDWRVTSDAVFVDTAGRYQTEGIDSEEWASLLETIKKYRGNRPVDGFLLVVSAETILKSDERQTEELAKVLRARLDDSMQRLKVRFPVYVVFTHADGIEGFRDSFSSSKNEDKTLVWGATIPIEKSENAQALFDGEYEVLHNSLMKRRIVRLSAPFPPVRQLRIFNFPLHFGSARRKFGAFINALFRPNPFSENPFLRGFYFTASPVGRTNGNAPATVGNPYFTERFFRDVVLRDKDLVKTFLESRQRPPILGWMLTILGGLTVFALLVMAGISLATNKQLLDDAEVRGQNLIQMVKADAGKNPLEKKEPAVREEINRTDDMRQLLAVLDEWDRKSPPLHMRFGLYSGTRVFKQNLLPNYLSVVEGRFKAPAVAKLESELEKFASSKPVANAAKLTEAEEKLLEKHLNMLKAYLMLSGEYKEHAQGEHIASVLKEYWSTESKTPADLKNVADLQLEFWAKQVDRDDVAFPRIPLRPKLVADVRSKLKDFPAPYRYLSRKVTEVSKQVDDTVGPMNVDGILSRASSDSSLLTGDYRVPGAYTRAGYDLMKVAIRDAPEEMKKDDWVMGGAANTDVAQASETARIEDKYLRDYASHWTNLVRATDVKRYDSRDDALKALQAFSQPDSPMRLLSREISINTNLSQELQTDDWWPWIKSFFTSKKAGPGNSEPEKAFRPLFDFVGQKDQKSQFDAYQNEMNRLHGAINTKTNSDSDLKRLGEELSSNDKDTLDVKKRETAVLNLVAPFNSTTSGQALAELLQEPIGRLRTQMGIGGKEVLAKLWNDQILPAARAIEKGYPFDQSDAEADPKVLAQFLAPGEGTLSKFYDEKLKNYFELSNGRYQPKEGGDIQFTEEFVSYLNNAFALREVMFGKSPTLKFEYEFVLKPVKDPIIEITIDGQPVKSEGTGSLKGSFPGTNASETGVIMKVASTSGPVAASPPSANSSNSNVSGVSGSTSGGSGDRVFQGQWGLFRFVDAGSPEKQPGGEYLLKYTIGGRTVTATIRASGGGDPFNKSMFSQLKAPQALMK